MDAPTETQEKGSEIQALTALTEKFSTPENRQYWTEVVADIEGDLAKLHQALKAAADKSRQEGRLFNPMRTLAEWHTRNSAPEGVWTGLDEYGNPYLKFDLTPGRAPESFAREAFQILGVTPTGNPEELAQNPDFHKKYPHIGSMELSGRTTGSWVVEHPTAVPGINIEFSTSGTERFNLRMPGKLAIDLAQKLPSPPPART